MSAAVGLITATAVMSAAVFVIRSRPALWSSRASLLILPGPSANPVLLPSYYEALTRGQIVATYAELIRVQQFERDVRPRGQLGSTSTSLRVSIVPDTSIIALTTEASSFGIANAVTNAVAERAVSYIRDLNQPYAATILSTEPAVGTGVPTSSMLVVGSIAALALGLLAQQAIYQLAAFRDRQSPTRKEIEPLRNGAHADAEDAHRSEPPPSVP